MILGCFGVDFGLILGCVGMILGWFWDERQPQALKEYTAREWMREVKSETVFSNMFYYFLIFS